MPPITARLGGLLAGAALALAAVPASAAVNVIPSAWIAANVDGVHGVLRPGSPWGPGSAPSDETLPLDGLFAPEGQQWNNGSLWWDEDDRVNVGTVHYTVVLDGLYTFNRFVAQADDNDSYLLEWWDGGAWQAAWNIAAVNTFGLVTRDSGVLGPITTDRLRFSATGGDDYYALSELQAFAIPEPTTWALMIAGFGLAGAALRRRNLALTAS